MFASKKQKHKSFFSFLIEMLIKELSFRSPLVRRVFLITSLILFIRLILFSLETVKIKVGCKKEVRIFEGTGPSLTDGVQTNDDDNLTVIPTMLFNSLVASLNITAKYPGIELYISYTTALLRLKPLPNVEPIRKDLGPAINDVTSFLFPIQNAKSTEKIGRASKSIFIAVVSAPGNFKRRELIRKTWFNHLKDSFYHRDLVDFVGFGFFMGKTSDSDIQYRIEQEAVLHKDIIQVDMIDDYYQLGKKAAALFYWIENNCAGVDFVLKIDDDVYVNVRNLATTVALQMSPFSNAIYGQDYANRIPMRDGKWKVDVEFFPWNEYPSYFSGACVLIPGRQVMLMLAAIQTTPYFPIDDLYLTGLCVAHAKIQRRQSEKFFSLEGFAEPCYVRETAVWAAHFTEMLAFNNATEAYYNKRSKCVLSNQAAVNPDDVFPIEFNPLI